MASSCTCTPKFLQRLGREIIVLQFDWIAHTDGTFASVSTDDYTFGNRILTKIVTGKRIFLGRSIPGSVTAPTALYDIGVVDADGEDFFVLAMNDRSATATESELTPFIRFIEGPVSITITNNSVNSATGTIKLYFG